jgi:hypothetical protein
MALSLQKITIYQLLLAICLAVPYLGNYELTFAIWVGTVLVTLQQRYSVTLAKYALCFVAIVVVAFFSTTFARDNLFYIIRDITYLLKPVIGLLVGYQLCRHNYRNAFRTIAYIGFMVSVIHLLVIGVTFLRFYHLSVNLIRVYSGYFSDFEVYALVLVLFHNKFGIHFSKKIFYLLAVTIGFSAALYLARTNFIQFAILVMGLKGYFVLNRRALAAITTVVVLAVVSYSAVLYINPKRNGEGIEAFLYKIKVAPTEPFKMKINKDDYKDFNDNYRSVELIHTFKQVTMKGPATIIAGKGLGSQVDLKREVYLGDMFLRYISVLHNSFMTAFLKSGVIGMLLLLYSIIMLYRQKKSDVPINKQINLLIMGTAVFMLVSNWVLMGYYFTEDSKSILVGFLFAYKEITERNAKTATITGASPE